jgi:hypothetical protein
LAAIWEYAKLHELKMVRVFRERGVTAAKESMDRIERLKTARRRMAEFEAQEGRASNGAEWEREDLTDLGAEQILHCGRARNARG